MDMQCTLQIAFNTVFMMYVKTTISYVSLIYKPSYLVEIMGEYRCIVINILHQYCNVGLGLMLAVCGSDSKGVPRLLLKVQRGSE